MQRAIAAVAAAAFLTALAACNTDELPPPGEYATVTGRVVDAATHQPIAGALVTIDTALTATTDANGAFTIATVPAGTLDYTIEANGYRRVAATASAEPAKTFELDVTLTH